MAVTDLGRQATSSLKTLKKYWPALQSTLVGCHHGAAVGQSRPSPHSCCECVFHRDSAFSSIVENEVHHSDALVS